MTHNYNNKYEKRIVIHNHISLINIHSLNLNVVSMSFSITVTIGAVLIFG